MGRRLLDGRPGQGVADGDVPPEQLAQVAVVEQFRHDSRVDVGLGKPGGERMSSEVRPYVYAGVGSGRLMVREREAG